MSDSSIWHNFNCAQWEQDQVTAAGWENRKSHSPEFPLFTQSRTFRSGTGNIFAKLQISNRIYHLNSTNFAKLGPASGNVEHEMFSFQFWKIFFDGLQSDETSLKGNESAAAGRKREADIPDIIKSFYLSRNKYFILFQITCWSIVCQWTITVGSLVVSYLNSDTAAATNSFLFGKHTIKLTFDFSVCLSTP